MNEELISSNTPSLFEVRDRSWVNLRDLTSQVKTYNNLLIDVKKIQLSKFKISTLKNEK